MLMSAHDVLQHVKCTDSVIMPLALILTYSELNISQILTLTMLTYVFCMLKVVNFALYNCPDFKYLKKQALP